MDAHHQETQQPEKRMTGTTHRNSNDWNSPITAAENQPQPSILFRKWCITSQPVFIFIMHYGSKKYSYLPSLPLWRGWKNGGGGGVKCPKNSKWGRVVSIILFVCLFVCLFAFRFPSLGLKSKSLTDNSTKVIFSLWLGSISVTVWVQRCCWK